VLDWEPPTRLRYLWHLFFDASEATEMELTFTAVPAGTAVRLEQRGWDALGDTDLPAPLRRERTGHMWGRLTGDYARACA
jgi:Activator of Hsp90 ATPase homolog 1-like protein